MGVCSMADDIKQENKPEQEKSLVEQANAAAERIEKANAEYKALMEKQEVMAANARLGGKSDAGTKNVKQDIDPREYAKMVLTGRLPKK